MGGWGIHMQLPYTVINMWRIHMWGVSHVWRGALACGSFSHVEGALMFRGFLTCRGAFTYGSYSCVGVSHV